MAIISKTSKVDPSTPSRLVECPYDRSHYIDCRYNVRDHLSECRRGNGNEYVPRFGKQNGVKIVLSWRNVSSPPKNCRARRENGPCVQNDYIHRCTCYPDIPASIVTVPSWLEVCDVMEDIDSHLITKVKKPSPMLVFAHALEHYHPQRTRPVRNTRHLISNAETAWDLFSDDCKASLRQLCKNKRDAGKSSTELDTEFNKLSERLQAISTEGSRRNVFIAGSEFDEDTEPLLTVHDSVRFTPVVSGNPAPENTAVPGPSHVSKTVSPDSEDRFEDAISPCGSTTSLDSIEYEMADTVITSSKELKESTKRKLEEILNRQKKLHELKKSKSPVLPRRVTATPEVSPIPPPRNSLLDAKSGWTRSGGFGRARRRSTTRVTASRPGGFFRKPRKTKTPSKRKSVRRIPRCLPSAPVKPLFEAGYSGHFAVLSVEDDFEMDTSEIVIPDSSAMKSAERETVRVYRERPLRLCAPTKSENRSRPRKTQCEITLSQLSTILSTALSTPGVEPVFESAFLGKPLPTITEVFELEDAISCVEVHPAFAPIKKSYPGTPLLPIVEELESQPTPLSYTCLCGQHFSSVPVFAGHIFRNHHEHLRFYRIFVDESPQVFVEKVQLTLLFERRNLYNVRRRITKEHRYVNSSFDLKGDAQLLSSSDFIRKNIVESALDDERTESTNRGDNWLSIYLRDCARSCVHFHPDLLMNSIDLYTRTSDISVSLYSFLLHGSFCSSSECCNMTAYFKRFVSSLYDFHAVPHTPRSTVLPSATITDFLVYTLATFVSKRSEEISAPRPDCSMKEMHSDCEFRHCLFDPPIRSVANFFHLRDSVSHIAVQDLSTQIPPAVGSKLTLVHEAEILKAMSWPFFLRTYNTFIYRDMPESDFSPTGDCCHFQFYEGIYKCLCSEDPTLRRKHLDVSPADYAAGYRNLLISEMARRERESSERTVSNYSQTAYLEVLSTTDSTPFAYYIRIGGTSTRNGSSGVYPFACPSFKVSGKQNFAYYRTEYARHEVFYRGIASFEYDDQSKDKAWQRVLADLQEANINTIYSPTLESLPDTGNFLYLDAHKVTPAGIQHNFDNFSEYLVFICPEYGSVRKRYFQDKIFACDVVMNLFDTNFGHTDHDPSTPRKGFRTADFVHGIPPFNVNSSRIHRHVIHLVQATLVSTEPHTSLSRLLTNEFRNIVESDIDSSYGTSPAEIGYLSVISYHVVNLYSIVCSLISLERDSVEGIRLERFRVALLSLITPSGVNEDFPGFVDFLTTFRRDSDIDPTYGVLDLTRRAAKEKSNQDRPYQIAESIAIAAAGKKKVKLNLDPHRDAALIAKLQKKDSVYDPHVLMAIDDSGHNLHKVSRSISKLLDACCMGHLQHMGNLEVIEIGGDPRKRLRPDTISYHTCYPRVDTADEERFNDLLDTLRERVNNGEGCLAAQLLSDIELLENPDNDISETRSICFNTFQDCQYHKIRRVDVAVIQDVYGVEPKEIIMQCNSKGISKLAVTAQLDCTFIQHHADILINQAMDITVLTSEALENTKNFHTVIGKRTGGKILADRVYFSLNDVSYCHKRSHIKSWGAIQLMETFRIEDATIGSVVECRVNMRDNICGYLSYIVNISPGDVPRQSMADSPLVTNSYPHNVVKKLMRGINRNVGVMHYSLGRLPDSLSAILSKSKLSEEDILAMAKSLDSRVTIANQLVKAEKTVDMEHMPYFVAAHKKEADKVINDVAAIPYANQPCSSASNTIDRFLQDQIPDSSAEFRKTLVSSAAAASIAYVASKLLPRRNFSVGGDISSCLAVCAIAYMFMNTSDETEFIDEAFTSRKQTYLDIPTFYTNHFIRRFNKGVGVIPGIGFLEPIRQRRFKTVEYNVSDIEASRHAVSAALKKTSPNISHFEELSPADATSLLHRAVREGGMVWRSNHASLPARVPCKDLDPLLRAEDFPQSVALQKLIRRNAKSEVKKEFNKLFNIWQGQSEKGKVCVATAPPYGELAEIQKPAFYIASDLADVQRQKIHLINAEIPYIISKNFFYQDAIASAGSVFDGLTVSATDRVTNIALSTDTFHGESFVIRKYTDVGSGHVLHELLTRYEAGTREIYEGDETITLVLPLCSNVSKDNFLAAVECLTHIYQVRRSELNNFHDIWMESEMTGKRLGSLYTSDQHYSLLTLSDFYKSGQSFAYTEIAGERIILDRKNTKYLDSGNYDRVPVITGGIGLTAEDPPFFELIWNGVPNLPAMPARGIESQMIRFQGYAGSGKSASLARISVRLREEGFKVVYLTQLRGNSRDFQKKTEWAANHPEYGRGQPPMSCSGMTRNIFTMDAALEAKSLPQVDVVLVDEYCTSHSHMVKCLITRFGASKAILCGDHKQCKYFVRGPMPTLYNDYDNIPSGQCANVSHRVPHRIAHMFNNLIYKGTTEDDMYLSCNPCDEIIQIKTYAEFKNIDKRGIKILNSQQDQTANLRKLYPGYNISTAHESQGETHKDVAIVKMNEVATNGLWDPRQAHYFVMVTRSEEKITHYAPPGCTTKPILEKAIKDVENSPNRKAHLRTLSRFIETQDRNVEYYVNFVKDEVSIETLFAGETTCWLRAAAGLLRDIFGYNLSVSEAVKLVNFRDGFTGNIADVLDEYTIPKFGCPHPSILSVTSIFSESGDHYAVKYINRCHAEYVGRVDKPLKLGPNEVVNYYVLDQSLQKKFTGVPYADAVLACDPTTNYRIDRFLGFDLKNDFEYGMEVRNSYAKQTTCDRLHVAANRLESFERSFEAKDLEVFTDLDLKSKGLLHSSHNITLDPLPTRKHVLVDIEPRKLRSGSYQAYRDRIARLRVVITRLAMNTNSCDYYIIVPTDAVNNGYIVCPNLRDLICYLSGGAYIVNPQSLFAPTIRDSMIQVKYVPCISRQPQPSVGGISGVLSPVFERDGFELLLKSGKLLETLSQKLYNAFVSKLNFSSQSPNDAFSSLNILSTYFGCLDGYSLLPDVSSEVSLPVLTDLRRTYFYCLPLLALYLVKPEITRALILEVGIPIINEELLKRIASRLFGKLANFSFGAFEAFSFYGNSTSGRVGSFSFCDTPVDPLVSMNEPSILYEYASAMLMHTATSSDDSHFSFFLNVVRHVSFDVSKTAFLLTSFYGSSLTIPSDCLGSDDAIEYADVRSYLSDLAMKAGVTTTSSAINFLQSISFEESDVDHLQVAVVSVLFSLLSSKIVDYVVTRADPEMSVSVNGRNYDASRVYALCKILSEYKEYLMVSIFFCVSSYFTDLQTTAYSVLLPALTTAIAEYSDVWTASYFEMLIGFPQMASSGSPWSLFSRLPTAALHHAVHSGYRTRFISQLVFNHVMSINCGNAGIGLSAQRVINSALSFMSFSDPLIGFVASAVVAMIPDKFQTVISCAFGGYILYNMTRTDHSDNSVKRLEDDDVEVPVLQSSLPFPSEFGFTKEDLIVHSISFITGQRIGPQSNIWACACPHSPLLHVREKKKLFAFKKNLVLCYSSHILDKSLPITYTACLRARSVVIVVNDIDPNFKIDSEEHRFDEVFDNKDETGSIAESTTSTDSNSEDADGLSEDLTPTSNVVQENPVQEKESPKSSTKFNSNTNRPYVKIINAGSGVGLSCGFVSMISILPAQHPIRALSIPKAVSQLREACGAAILADSQSDNIYYPYLVSINLTAEEYAQKVLSHDFMATMVEIEILRKLLDIATLRLVTLDLGAKVQSTFIELGSPSDNACRAIFFSNIHYQYLLYGTDDEFANDTAHLHIPKSALIEFCQSLGTFKAPSSSTSSEKKRAKKNKEESSTSMTPKSVVSFARYDKVTHRFLFDESPISFEQTASEIPPQMNWGDEVLPVDSETALPTVNVSSGHDQESPHTIPKEFCVEYKTPSATTSEDCYLPQLKNRLRKSYIGNDFERDYKALRSRYSNVLSLFPISMTLNDRWSTRGYATHGTNPFFATKFDTTLFDADAVFGCKKYDGILRYERTKDSRSPGPAIIKLCTDKSGFPCIMPDPFDPFCSTFNYTEKLYYFDVEIPPVRLSDESINLSYDRRRGLPPNGSTLPLESLKHSLCMKLENFLLDKNDKPKETYRRQPGDTRKSRDHTRDQRHDLRPGKDILGFLRKHLSSLRKQLNIKYPVTNCTSKFLELYNFTNVPLTDTRAAFICEAPGAAVDALKCYSKGTATILAQSFVRKDADDRTGVLDSKEDRYNMENFPSEWILDIKNGDILDDYVALETIKRFQELKPTLVVFDGGLDCKERPELQSEELFSLLQREVFMSLQSVVPGGCVIGKSWNSDVVEYQQLFNLFSQHFSHAYVVKPVASRAFNSEVYWVGMDKKNRDTNIDNIKYYSEMTTYFQRKQIGQLQARFMYHFNKPYRFGVQKQTLELFKHKSRIADIIPTYGSIFAASEKGTCLSKNDYYCTIADYPTYTDYFEKTDEVRFSFEQPKDVYLSARYCSWDREKQLKYQKKCIEQKKVLVDFVDKYASSHIGVTIDSRRPIIQYPKRFGSVPSVNILPVADAVGVINYHLGQRFPAVLDAKNFCEIDNLEDSIATKNWRADQVIIPLNSLGFIPKLEPYHPSKVLGGVSACTQPTGVQLLSGMDKRTFGVPELSRESEDHAAAANIYCWKKYACRQDVDWEGLKANPIMLDRSRIEKYIQKLDAPKVGRLISQMSDGALVELMFRPSNKMELSVKKDLKVIGNDNHVNERQKSQVIQAADVIQTVMLGPILKEVDFRLQHVLLPQFIIGGNVSPDDFIAHMNYHLLEKELVPDTLSDVRRDRFKKCRRVIETRSRADRLSDIHFIDNDAKSFDKSQDRDSGKTIYLALREIGLDPRIAEIMKGYFNNCSAKYAGAGIKAYIKGMMRSGCLPTFSGNTALTTLTSARVFREILRDSLWAAFAGDDITIATKVPIPLIQERVALYPDLTNLEVKLEIGSFVDRIGTLPPSFCGCFILLDEITQNLAMIPDPIKKLFKIRPIRVKEWSNERLEARALSYREDILKMSRIGIKSQLEEAVLRKYKIPNIALLVSAMYSIFQDLESYKSAYGPITNGF